MLSPWRNPLPLGKYTTSRVAVYFYSGRWVPIMFHSLGEAIALSRKAVENGKEIFIFPADFNPCDFCEPLSEVYSTAADSQPVRQNQHATLPFKQARTVVGSR